MNPPFNAPQNPSPDRGRRVARDRDHTRRSAVWLRTAARLLRPAGVVTLIWRADGLADVLAALAHGVRRDFGLADPSQARRCGDPRAGARAKGRDGPLSLLPGFVLADADGKPSAAAEAVLRDGAVASIPEELRAKCYETLIPETNSGKQDFLLSR